MSADHIPHLEAGPAANSEQRSARRGRRSPVASDGESVAVARARAVRHLSLYTGDGLRGGASCPLPDDPALASAAMALNSAGYWADVVDREWRWVYMTDDVRLTFGALLERVPFARGAHYFSEQAVKSRLAWRMGWNTIESARESLRSVAGWMLGDTPGGRERLRKRVHPALADIVDHARAQTLEVSTSFEGRGMGIGATWVTIPTTLLRVRGADGEIAGTVIMYKPAAGMAMLAAVTAGGDLRHFERMQIVAKAGRRPAAIMFADLEASSALGRRLSTANYFAIGRRMVRAADSSVIDAGGLVGRHVGDGVVAFFLAETSGSETAAARACIEAARAISRSMTAVAERSELRADELVMRFGLHWGATPYVGQIATSGRAEVTALGDEVNETARIEACASGGRLLASKELIERLEAVDADALGIELHRLKYTRLAELPSATEKARRDAPALAVCEL